MNVDHNRKTSPCPADLDAMDVHAQIVYELHLSIRRQTITGSHSSPKIGINSHIQ
jgi:hypothetical protein